MHADCSSKSAREHRHVHANLERILRPTAESIEYNGYGMGHLFARSEPPLVSRDHYKGWGSSNALFIEGIVAR